MRIIALLLLFAVTGSIYARPTLSKNGNMVGNGGKVVVCTDQAGQILNIELMDFYLARVFKTGFPTSMSKENIDEFETYAFPEGDVLSKVKATIARLKTLDPLREEMYQIEADNFFANAEFVHELPETDDVTLIMGGGALPANCSLAQAAAQSMVRRPHEKIYRINTRLWDLMSDDQRAGLILHEIVYRKALLQGHRHAGHVQGLTALMASNILPRMRWEDYKRFLKDEGFLLLSIKDGQKIWFFVQYLLFTGIDEDNAAVAVEASLASKSCQNLFKARRVNVRDIESMPKAINFDLAKQISQYFKEKLVFSTDRPGEFVFLEEANLLMRSTEAKVSSFYLTPEQDYVTVKTGILCVSY